MEEEKESETEEDIRRRNRKRRYKSLALINETSQFSSTQETHCYIIQSLRKQRYRIAAENETNRQENRSVLKVI